MQIFATLVLSGLAFLLVGANEEPVWKRHLSGSATAGYCSLATVRPGFSAAPPTCTQFPVLESRADARVVWWPVESGLATTSPKNGNVTVNGSDLVFLRDASTALPPAPGAGSCPGDPPCFNLMDGLASVDTCVGTSLASPFRGTLNGLSLKAQIDAVNASATSRHPGRRPLHTIAGRFDTVTPALMQIAGFRTEWLVTTGTPWVDFLDWLDDDTSPVCATENADCEGAAVGEDGFANACCAADASAGSYPDDCASDLTWANACDGECSWSFSNLGNLEVVEHGTCGWRRGMDGMDEGFAYDDIVTALAGDPEDYVYSVPSPASQRFYPDGMLVRMDTGLYQDWIIRAMDFLRVEAGADMLHLNHNFDQHYGGSNYFEDLVTKYDGAARSCDGGDNSGRKCAVDGDCTGGTCPAAVTASACVTAGGTCTASASCVSGTLAGAACKDGVVQVTEVVANGSGAFSGDQTDSGYTYDRYVSGLYQIAMKLNSLLIPYSIVMGPGLWDTVCIDPEPASGTACAWDFGGSADDEAAMIRDMAYRASLVFVEGAEVGGLTTPCNSACDNCVGSRRLRCELTKRGVPWLDLSTSDFTAATCS